MSKLNLANNLNILFSDYFRQHSNPITFKTSGSWVILSPIEQQIKRKIEEKGIPLKDWDIRINYGIKTGFNDAFIIDGEKRKELIEQDPNSDEIIRPILRGRDIKRYGYDFADLWLINTHNGIKEKGIEPINIDDYPAIKKHLDQYYPQLKKRADKGDTPYNLRNCAYMEDFYKQKIIWGNLNLKASYCFAPNGYFISAPSVFFASESNYLLAVLNSKVADYYIRNLGVTRSGGYFEYKPMFIEQLPIPTIDKETESKISNILIRKDSNLNKEDDLDNVIYKIYNFTSEEIRFIELQ